MCVKPGVRRKVPAGVSLCSFEIQIAHKKDESLEKEGAGAIREQQQRSSLFAPQSSSGTSQGTAQNACLSSL